MSRRLWCLAAALLFLAGAAEARVTRIEIARQEPFAAGEEFGTVGKYEKLVGRFYGELDPAAASNSRSRQKIAAILATMVPRSVPLSQTHSVNPIAIWTAWMP